MELISSKESDLTAKKQRLVWWILWPATLDVAFSILIKVSGNDANLRRDR